ncbi:MULTISPECIES: VOC family protein [Sphingomonadales]|uniref:VOC family protein n=1 Tax=Sphingomonadales TaxID=204457 RepID=UPI0032630937
MADIIKRTTIMVRDGDKAKNWYEQVFGMTAWMDTPFTLSGTQLAAGKKGDQTRLIILKCEHDMIGMIGLLEWIDPKQDAPAELPTEIAFGTPVFVVASEDATGALERARALGSTIHSEPRDWTVTGADGKQKDMIGCSFWDLDGYFYEVNQVVKVHD